MLFLDEPTTGLDPTARAALWDLVGDLTAGGTTVVLTTQYLEEADRFADHIVLLDHGRLVDRPDREGPAGDGYVTASFSVGDAGGAAELVARITRDRIDVADLEITSPSLDDVFAHLTLTGAKS